ncbi:hypothetical protein DB346_05820 [Verrucomicrobia bacterium LW23]|nr:hypothetical protein DB346_05820 [Verrucomicrobia bacterium LW23]
MGNATCIYYYGEGPLADNPLCCMDIHMPAGASAPVPVLVWFHGGGFATGSKDFGPEYVRIVTDLGYAMAIPNYRLAPAARHPEYLRDGATALAWVQRNGAAYGLDIQRLMLGGISAGAYLAALLHLHPTLLAQAGGDASAIRGNFLLSGQVTTHFQILAEQGISPYAVVSDDLSPLRHIRPGLPPIALLVGDNDIPNRLEENALFAAALRRAGNTQVLSAVIPHREHGDMEGRMPEPGDPVQVALVEFLRKLLNKINISSPPTIPT